LPGAVAGRVRLRGSDRPRCPGAAPPSLPPCPGLSAGRRRGRHDRAQSGQLVSPRPNVGSRSGSLPATPGLPEIAHARHLQGLQCGSTTLRSSRGARRESADSAGPRICPARWRGGRVEAVSEPLPAVDAAQVGSGQLRGGAGCPTTAEAPVAVDVARGAPAQAPPHGDGEALRRSRRGLRESSPGMWCRSSALTSSVMASAPHAAMRSTSLSLSLLSREISLSGPRSLRVAIDFWLMELRPTSHSSL
jgi:hypothetical protein